MIYVLISNKPEINRCSLDDCLENVNFIVNVEFIWLHLEKQETIEYHQEQDEQNLREEQRRRKYVFFQEEKGLRKAKKENYFVGYVILIECQTAHNE